MEKKQKQKTEKQILSIVDDLCMLLYTHLVTLCVTLETTEDISC